MLNGPNMHMENAEGGAYGKFGCCQLYLAVKRVSKYAYLLYYSLY